MSNYISSFHSCFTCGFSLGQVWPPFHEFKDLRVYAELRKARPCMELLPKASAQPPFVVASGGFGHCSAVQHRAIYCSCILVVNPVFGDSHLNLQSWLAPGDGLAHRLSTLDTIVSEVCIIACAIEQYMIGSKTIQLSGAVGVILLSVLPHPVTTPMLSCCVWQLIRFPHCRASASASLSSAAAAAVSVAAVAAERTKATVLVAWTWAAAVVAACGSGDTLT